MIGILKKPRSRIRDLVAKYHQNLEKHSVIKPDIPDGNPK